MIYKYIIEKKILVTKDTDSSLSGEYELYSSKTDLPETDLYPIVTLKENLLYLNPTSMETLKVKPGDRVNVKYILVQDSAFIPVINKVLDNESIGCKVNKNMSVIFKGEQNDILKEYGEKFILQSTDKEGVYKMTSRSIMNEIKKENTVYGIPFGYQYPVKDNKNYKINMDSLMSESINI